MICVINGAKTACKTNIYMYIIIGAHTACIKADVYVTFGA